MTEYWVSQGNKWCDFCKIFISSNPISIRNHELGQRHKDAVAKKITTMRQDKAAKDKEVKEAARSLEQIEAKAQRSYQKDISTFKEARNSNAQALISQEDGQGTAMGSTISADWEFDSATGYYYDQRNNCHYDPNSGFYYTDAIGKWVTTHEEALSASQSSSTSISQKSMFKKPQLSSDNKTDIKNQTSSPASVNPVRGAKGAAPSSLMVNKRKRQDKPKAISAEEAAALKAREAARKRVEDREKSLLGLYKH